MSRVLPILFNGDMVRAILDNHKTVTRRLVKPTLRPDESGFQVFTNMGTKERWIEKADLEGGSFDSPLYVAPPYQPGDVLYVRETWQYLYELDGNEQIIEGTGRYYYAATDTTPFDTYVDSNGVAHPNVPWRASIHMPKAAARIWLKVTDVRVERLQEITEEQAIKEGIIRLYDNLSDADYIDWAMRTGVYPRAKEDWGYKNYLWHGNFGVHGIGNKLSDAWKYQYSSYDSVIDSFSSLWNTTVPLKDWNIHGWDANPWVWVIEFKRCEKPEVENV